MKTILDNRRTLVELEFKTSRFVKKRSTAVYSSASRVLIICLVAFVFGTTLVSAQKPKPILRAYLELKSFGDGKGTVLLRVINPLKFPITISIDHKEEFNVPAKGSADKRINPGSNRTIYATGGRRELDPPMVFETHGGEVLELTFSDSD